MIEIILGEELRKQEESIAEEIRLSLMKRYDRGLVKHKDLTFEVKVIDAEDRVTTGDNE